MSENHAAKGGIQPPAQWEEISAKIRECVESEGCELVEIKLYKEYGKLNVTALIWTKAGISLDDCERVHNALSDMLDGYQDCFTDDYVLNVSSQGLDRRIVTDDDLRRALDTEIEVFEGKERSAGVLAAYDADTVTLGISGKAAQTKTIQRKNITKMQPLIRF